VITFSFAIAGMLIDFMWVTTYLFAGVVSSATNTPTDTFFAVVQAGNPIDAAGHLQGGILGISQTTGAAFGNLIVSAFTDQSNLFWDLVSGFISVVATLIMLIAILVALLRLWVSLVISYINVLLDVVFAPWWLIAGLLPGSPFGIGAWFRDLISNLAVFPVAISFFLIANYFVQAFSNTSAPLYSNGLIPPLLGGADPQAVSAIIGLGFLLMLPTLLSSLKAGLKAPKINFGPFFAPIGVGAGVVMGAPKRAVSGVLNEATRLRYDKTTGHPVEPQGARRILRVMRGGGH
jgi:hypothetical protein